MKVLAAAAFGALGAALHDAIELAEVVTARRREVPDEWKRVGFLLAGVLRIVAGAALAALVAAAEEVGPVGAVLIGILGPLALQRVAGLMFDAGRGPG